MFLYFEIFTKIILKDNKVNMPINYFQINGLGQGKNFAMFKFVVSTTIPGQLEYFAQLPDRILYSELLCIVPEEWDISPENMKTFISILRRNPGHNLSNIKAKIHQECFRKQEDLNILSSIKDYKIPCEIDLVLKHNEMVFPNLSLYKTIVQNSTMSFDKLSTNISLIELLRKAKVRPNELLNFSHIEFDCYNTKRNQKYNITDCVRYLLEIFPFSHELIINCDTTNEEKCLETIRNIMEEKNGTLHNIKLVLSEDCPDKKNKNCRNISACNSESSSKKNSKDLFVSDNDATYISKIELCDDETLDPIEFRLDKFEDMKSNDFYHNSK